MIRTYNSFKFKNFGGFALLLFRIMRLVTVRNQTEINICGD